MMNRRTTFLGSAVAAVMMIAGCDAALLDTEASRVGAIGLASEFAVNDSETGRLPISVVDRTGNPVDVPVTWTTANARVATVDESGVVTGQFPGTTTITATAGGVSKASTVTVRQVATRLERLSSEALEGSEFEPLDEEVVVRLVDRHDNPVPGVTVDFQVVDGGGSVSPDRALTDSDGLASTLWTLGASGEQGLETLARRPTASQSLLKDLITLILARASRPTTTTPETPPPPPVKETPPPAPPATPPSQPVTAPHGVADLRVVRTTQNSITIRWTGVDDGNGGSAKYAMRAGSPVLRWDQAAETERAVSAGAKGSAIEHTFTDVPAGTSVEIQLISYRGTLGQQPALGGRSNVVAAKTASAAGGGGGGGGAEPPSNLGTLTISPTTVSLTGVGSTANLSAEARSTNGARILTPGVVWTSLNSGVATVNSSGRVTARAVGIAFIVATANCCSPDTVRVEVSAQQQPESPPPPTTPPPPTNPTPPPTTPSPGGAAYEQQWNFSSTQGLLAAAMGSPNCPVSLEQSSGIPTSTTGKFARTRYPGTGSEGSCNLDLALNIGNAREIWLEVWLRFDSNWGGTSDDKTLFVFSNAQGGRRWEIHYATPTRSFGGASNMAFEFTSDHPAFPGALDVVNKVWDGQWHRHRLHLKMGNGDGIFEWWFDDHPIITRTQASAGWVSRTGSNLNTGNPATDFFHSIRLGANADPRGSGTRDWGPVRVYTTNPGW